MSSTLISEKESGGLAAAGTRTCAVQHLGLVDFREGWRRQLEFVEAVKRHEISDQLIFVEHPATITLGRNANRSNILASQEVLTERAVALEETDRGGDVTFHGPGQIVGYPILDLKFWRRDVGAYLRALEDVLIRTLDEFGIKAGRLDGCTGVWVDGAKIAAIGVHLSRWVTSHGFALNVSINLGDFALIIPCGITKPLTSMERVLGTAPPSGQVTEALARHFGLVFERVVTDSNGRR